MLLMARKKGFRTSRDGAAGILGFGVSGFMEIRPRNLGGFLTIWGAFIGIIAGYLGFRV